MPITLWSVLKMYFEMKPVGACGIACAAWACKLMRGLLVCGSGSLSGRWGRLLLEEFLVVGIRDDIHETAHAVVSQPAQLSADNLVLPNRIGGEMKRNHHAGHRILLEAQLADKEIVDYVLRFDLKVHFAIHRHGQGGNHDVVSAGRIAGIEPQRVSRGGADQLGVKASEFSIGARVAEIENELVGGHLHLNGVGRSFRKPNIRPGLASEEAEADEKNDRRRSPQNFHGVVAASEVGFLALVAKTKDSVGQPQLRKDENHARHVKRQLILVVHCRA